MKKLFTLLMVSIFTVGVFSQASENMSYQAVIRDAGNALVTSHTVGMRITILQDSPTGTVVYTETQTPTTNINGLVSIEIGGGAGFVAIDWSDGPYFIKTETDPTGGTSYTIVGTSQLLSVPYSLYSKAAESSANAVTITGNQTITGIKTFSNDLLVNELTIGRGGGTNPSNTAIGYQTLNSITAGSYNTAIGYFALNNNTTGNSNTANGAYALQFNTTGYGNTAFGISVLSTNSTGYNNTATGTLTLYSNTTGYRNTANGGSALIWNTTGNSNTAVGYYALFSNSTGNNNTANGVNALQSNTTGYDNTANGVNALQSNTTGYTNTACGVRALSSITTGDKNTAIGVNSGNSVTTGRNLTLLGHNSQPSAFDAWNEITLGDDYVTSLRCNVQSITSLSDARDKKNITDLLLGLDFIMNLKPRQFNWDRREWYANNRSDGSKMQQSLSAGFIAQELDEVQKGANAEWLNLVLKDNPEKLETTAGNLLPIIVKAIQDQQKEIEVLKKELALLKSK